MFKLLFRFMACLLVPCLWADSATAGSLSNSFSFAKASGIQSFNDQALSPLSLEVGCETIDAHLIGQDLHQSLAEFKKPETFLFSVIRNKAVEQDPAELEHYVRYKGPLKETLKYIGLWIVLPGTVAALSVVLGLLLVQQQYWEPLRYLDMAYAVFITVASVMVHVSAARFAADHGDWEYRYQKQPDGSEKISSGRVPALFVDEARKFFRDQGMSYANAFLIHAALGGFFAYIADLSFASALIAVPMIVLYALVFSWRKHRRWNNLPYGSEKEKAEFARAGGRFTAVRIAAKSREPLPRTQVVALTQDLLTLVDTKVSSPPQSMGFLSIRKQIQRIAGAFRQSDLSENGVDQAAQAIFLHLSELILNGHLPDHWAAIQETGQFLIEHLQNSDNSPNMLRNAA